MSAVSSRSSHETAVVPCPIGGCLPALTPLGALAAAAGWGTAVPGGGATGAAAGANRIDAGTICGA